MSDYCFSSPGVLPFSAFHHIARSVTRRFVECVICGFELVGDLWEFRAQKLTS